MSKAERLLSYSLLSLITSTPWSSTSLTGISEDDEDTPPQRNGLLNEDGAWCWREGCQGAQNVVFEVLRLTKTWLEDCLKLTKSMQKTSDTLQIVADLYDDHVGVLVFTQRLGLTANKGPAYPACNP
jgi:sorting nexin-9/18/33